MKKLFDHIYGKIRNWLEREDGVAATEAAMIFPILLTMLLGTFDVGNGILANQKTIRASQIAADLVTRLQTVTDDDVDEAIEAARLAFNPFSTETFGVDIVSIRFDEDSDSSIVWRETRNMSPNANVLTDVEALADVNTGVVVVTVQYLYEPLFGDFVIDEFVIQEKAFARGRRSAVVSHE